MTSEERLEIKKIFTQALEQNPQAGEILKVFEPIIIRQRQLTEMSSFRNLDCSQIDKAKLKAGVPVSRQINLFLPEESLKEIAIKLAPAVTEGMPQLAENIERIIGLIQKGKINPADYFKAPAEGENDIASGWAENLKVSSSNALFLMALVSRVVLEQKAIEIKAALGEIEWDKGYCPICGSLPSIALIEEKGGRRFLHCSSCGHDWRFTRVICPACESESPEGMDYFYIENKVHEAAFICDKCKKYLVTLYRVGDLLARDMDVSAISLIHLDMIMQKKGYEPMATCLWNVL